MNEIQKITESIMLSRLHVGQVLLAPLVVRDVHFAPYEPDLLGRPDALVRLGLPDSNDGFCFVVESKSRSTPQAIQLAIANARGACGPERWPLIQVPYLSPERLEHLENEGVSGVDLCGNGVVVVPGRLWIKRTGLPNLYRDSRPLNNPYGGRSAAVARMLIMKPHWKSLSELAAGIRDFGTSLSLPQVSKAVKALAEELVVSKGHGSISLTEPLQVLDQLARAWRRPQISKRQGWRLASREGWQVQLSTNSHLRWAVTGESSLAHHAMFAQGGPRRIAVSSLSEALSSVPGNPESVPSFADVEFVETTEEGFFFANEVDEQGFRWASLLQTWVEAQGGDARQQEVARDLYKRILQGVRQ